MNAENFSVSQLLEMAHSPVRNYAIPGLTSWLIGSPSDKGTVRLFSCERDHQEAITPHSHRFDFQCWVLAGEVRNRIWTETDDPDADTYVRTVMRYDAMGKYERRDGHRARYRFKDQVFTRGQCYRMTAEEVHSIYFARGTEVLFFEGPNTFDSSVILEPYVLIHGQVETFKVEPWMFVRGQG